MASQKPDSPRQEVAHYLKALDTAKRKISVNFSAKAGKIDIEEETVRAQKIKNDNAEQDIRLKRVTLNRLFILLAAETVLIFIFAFLQATKLLNFQLEEWSFKLLVTATIAQITAMLFAAVRYLFPVKKSK